MSEIMAKPLTTRLLWVVVVLLCVIILLQLGLLFQRHLSRGDSSGTAPDVHTVWNRADEIQSMQARINRLFDQTFLSTLSVPQPPAVVSNAPSTDGSAVSFEDTFAHVRSMQRQIDALFEHAFDGTAFPGNAGFDDGWSRLQVTPGFNIQDKDQVYEVSVHLPGMDRSGIHITLNQSVLSIRAQQESRQEVQSSNHSARQIRRSSQHFERHLRLPGATSDQSQIKASFTNDLLSITIPKETRSNLVAQTIQVY